MMRQSSDNLLRVFGSVMRRGARLIGLVASAAVLAACAVPALYGPYYHAVYLGMSGEARIAPRGKSAAPPNGLWIEPGRGCRFQLWADADEANLVLSWDAFHLGGKVALCRVSDAPLMIQDLDVNGQNN